MPIRKRKTAPVKTDYDALLWCFRNDYKIYPETSDNQNYRVVVQKRGNRPKKSKELYSWQTIDKVINEVMIHLYEKNRRNGKS